MDHSSNKWSYFNRLYPNFRDKTYERSLEKDISLLPFAAVPSSCSNYRPLDNKQRRNYYSYFNDAHNFTVGSKRAIPQIKTDRASCENVSSRKRKPYHDKRFHNQRDARFVKSTAATLIKRLNDPQLITIPENELRMKKRILEKTRELLQLIEFRQRYHKHLIEFKRLVSKLTKRISSLMKYTQHNYSDNDKLNKKKVPENIFKDECDSDNGESTTRVESFKYCFEKTHRSKKHIKLKRNELTKGTEVQCTSMFSMMEKWPRVKKLSIQKETKSVQWLGMSDKCTQLYCKRKSSRKKHHRKMNVQLQTNKENVVDNDQNFDSLNQATSTVTMPPEFNLTTVSVANCIPLLCKRPKDPFFFPSPVKNTPITQNTKLDRPESECEWTCQEDEVCKKPKVIISSRIKSPSLIVEYPHDEFCENNKKDSKDILSPENKVLEMEFPNTLGSLTNSQPIACQKRRKQKRDSLAIKNIFTTDFFDENSTDNETLYCGFEIEELCRKKSCFLSNTTSENDSMINSKKVRKFSKLPQPPTSAEPCEVKFKFNRNICTFSVNYNPLKVLRNLTTASNQSQINNKRLEISESEKQFVTIKQSEHSKEFMEVTNNSMVQSKSLINTNLSNIFPQKCDDANNLSKIQSGSLSENDMVNTSKNKDELTSKNGLLSSSEFTNKIRPKRKRKSNNTSDIIKRKNKYIKAKKKRASFSKHKKSQLENKNRNVNEKPVSKNLDESTTNIDNHVDKKLVDTKLERDDTQCLVQEKKPDNAYVPKTNTSETTVQRDIIEASQTIEETLNVLSTNSVDLNPRNVNIVETNNFDGTNPSNVYDSKTKTSEITVQHGVIETSGTINETLTNTVDINSKNVKLVENKDFDGSNLSKNSTSTREMTVDVVDSKKSSCSNIKKSEMTENDNCRHLKSLNKRASTSIVTKNKISFPRKKQMIENKTNSQNCTGNQGNKSYLTPLENCKKAKRLVEPTVKGIYVTLKLPEKKPETCPHSEKNKIESSKIPKLRCMKVSPVSKRNNETVNKNESVKNKPKTEPNSKSPVVIDEATKTNAAVIVKTIENKDAAENINEVQSVDVNNRNKNQNINKNKVIKLSKINSQKRPSVSEEETTAKRRRTNSKERRFPSPALTKPTISSLNKQNNRSGPINESKFRINLHKNRGRGPVKILSFLRKPLGSNRNLIDKKKQSQSDICKNLDYNEKIRKFQSQNIFQQYRSVLCARRFRKQYLLRNQIAERNTNDSRKATSVGKNKKLTEDLTVERLNLKTNEINMLNNFQNRHSKINSNDLSDSATQSICPIRRRVKRLRQPFYKYTLSRYPLWYTLKRRWLKDKQRKRKDNIHSLKILSLKSSSDDQPYSSRSFNCQTSIASKTKSKPQLQAHSSNEGLNLPNSKSNHSFSCCCIKIDKSEKGTEIINEIKDTKISDNVGFENVPLQNDDKKVSDATLGVKNERKLTQNEISPENGQLSKALEELKRYIESALTKGFDEKQRIKMISLNEGKHRNGEQVIKNNSEEMLKNALNTLHSTERNRLNIHPDEKSSIIDETTISFSSFSKTQSLATLSTSESHKSLNNSTDKYNEFKLSFSSEKVREFIKKSCRNVSRIPVPLNTRRSSSEQNLREIYPKYISKVSSSTSHSISSISAKHHPSMMCCNQLDTCSVFLFEVARHSREWSKWVRQIFSGINKFTSFIKEMKDDDVKLEQFYLKDWREFTAMVDKMLASWRQYSKEVKKVTEHVIRKFKRIDNQCCPKCIEDGIISDRTMMREVAKKLIDAITTAELWRTWLDDIMKQASLLVDIQPNDRHQQKVVDYSKHTYDDMVQTFSQIAFCIGEASRVIQRIDISDQNK